MTIFTKTDSEEKDAKEEEPKIIPPGLTTLNTPAPEERYISNYGWVPMEGGNFDRPRENRNSSSGPLSIIRLSSSPLNRTPSPTLPEQENGGNKRRQRCKLLVILVVSLLCLILGATLLFCHTRLVRSAYNDGIYSGWNAAIYRNHGLLQRLEENVEINPTRVRVIRKFENEDKRADNYSDIWSGKYSSNRTLAESETLHHSTITLRIETLHSEPDCANYEDQLYEKIEVPRLRTNRPSIFLHDFKKNITAIVDIIGRRCFLKAIDPRTVVTHKKLMLLLAKIPLSYQTTENTVREVFRVGNLLSRLEIQELGSFIITRYCLLRPTYKLIKFQAGMAKQRKEGSTKLEASPKLEFVFTGGNDVELDAIVF